VGLRWQALACVFVSAISAVLFYNEFHAYSSDAGQHYALVRALTDSTWAKLEAPHLSGSLTGYPPFSHWLAAQFASVTGSGFVGMTIVASASVSVFYVVMYAISSRIDWRIPLLACAITVVYALFRGPVFGRLIVNNYFYAQVVGSGITALVLLVIASKLRQWNGFALDLFVIVAVQLEAATHLMPAAQLASCYCFVLLYIAVRHSSFVAAVRCFMFALLCLLLTLLNPFAAIVYQIAQSEGGAHINLFGDRWAQIILLLAGVWSSMTLLRRSGQDDDAAIVLGCIGLGACCFAILQIIAFWLGKGSHYAIAKNMFFVVSVVIFVVSANMVMSRKPAPRSTRELTSALVCSLLALLTTRADLSPSVASLGKVAEFQAAARKVAAKLDGKDGRRPIVQSTEWPRNLSYGMTIGDMHLRMGLGEAALDDRLLPPNEVSLVLMPRKDLAVLPGCLTSNSNEIVAAMDYACFRGLKDIDTAGRPPF
jgi:hypothetical protein